jgi:tetratricopeptide (TPR) repeat protein
MNLQNPLVALESKCMRFNAFLLLVFLLSLLCTGVTRGAQNERVENAEAAFRSGVEAFQKKDFAHARLSFTDAMKLAGETPRLLFNLGMVESRQGKKGMALALWRKALAQKPNDAASKAAVEWTRARLEHADIPHEVEVWENFRQSALVPFALDHFVLFTALFLLAGGWLLFRHLGRRRSARLDEKPMPGFPAGTVFCLVASFAFATLALAKAFDLQDVRGTIVSKKVEARSSPATDATALFELYEGLEVIVRQKKDGWVQVTYPGASTGWISQQDLLAIDDSLPTVKESE